MDCPHCNLPMNIRHQCGQCGFDLDKSAWVIIKTVTPPEDAIIESVIQSFGIPVKLIHSTGSVLGVAIGPLGEVKIAVPEAYAERAQMLLQAELENTD